MAIIATNVVTFVVVHLVIGGSDLGGLRVRTIMYRYGFLPDRVGQIFENRGPLKLNALPNPAVRIKQGRLVPPPEQRTIVLQPSVRELVLSLFTSLFLHGGIIHLLGNMWFFWIFGNNIEDRLGHVTFLLFYLFGGVIASACHWLMIDNAEEALPVIGASGAVAVVLGAYAVTYPLARVRTFVCLIIFFTIIDLPALVVLGFWFLSQLLEAFGHVDMGISGGVAWWAHIGGFVAGLLVMPVLATAVPSQRKDWEVGSGRDFDFGQ